MKQKIIGALVWAFYKLLSSTWKMTIEEPESLTKALKDRTPFVIAHWHGDELVLVQFSGYFRLAIIASLSKDGEIMTTVIKLFGAVASRGSSSRGAVGALKGLLKLAKEGHNTSFAVDGPRGPIYKVKPGVFEVSKILNAPIYIPGVYCDRAWHFPKAWNKTYLPKPFAKIYIRWELGMNPLTEDQNPKDPAIAELLESRLNAAKQQAMKVIVEP